MQIENHIYRIVPVGRTEYHVQRKRSGGWFFWTVQQGEHARTFTSVETAKEWIDNDISESFQTALHLDEPPIYYP